MPRTYNSNGKDQCRTHLAINSGLDNLLAPGGPDFGCILKCLEFGLRTFTSVEIKRDIYRLQQQKFFGTHVWNKGNILLGDIETVLEEVIQSGKNPYDTIFLDTNCYITDKLLRCVRMSAKLLRGVHEPLLSVTYTRVARRKEFAIYPLRPSTITRNTYGWKLITKINYIGVGCTPMTYLSYKPA